MYNVCVCVCALSHVPLFAIPWTVALQAPLSMGFCRQEYWRGLPFPSPGDLPDPGVEPASLSSPSPPRWAGGFSSVVLPGRPVMSCYTLVVQSCPTLCNPVDYSLTGSSVHGIPQVRILKWVAIPFSRGFSQSRNLTPASHIAGRFFTI